ncbi:uncharacterized protein LOC127633446 isoform X5 [Xyrauchen texanus]|uniref:uncharacterized protein LOC127633446 isoform X4 n=1 Tax=Xyrauchen texanus TaxID=154827 RepID=UPI0022422ED6|nr:uncharacterized protein LOC127633446 isoform X4 [Xyrauchen texanus]XP_051968503.1 uncharacterized protein LOC127633446 isoform X5 [Xyrauchen texanus]
MTAPLNVFSISLINQPALRKQASNDGLLIFFLKAHFSLEELDECRRICAYIRADSRLQLELIPLTIMPAKDPLIETLKVCILNLKLEGTVTDSSLHLASCCEFLELILRKGLQQPVLSLAHRDYWHCFEQLLQHDSCGRLSSISLAVQQTTACTKLTNSQARGRFFIRLMLMRKTLGNVVKHLLHTNRVIELYSPYIAILRNEEFVEPFLSLSMVLSEMDFKLSIENCSFLDESWLLPVCEIYETVPCRELGVVLRYLDGRVFVFDLLQGSQAQVDMFAEPGDIIDEINGISLRNASNGQAGVVLSKLKGQPLSIRLIRWRGGDGSIYQPLVKHLRQLKQEKPSLQFGPKPASHQDRTVGQRKGQTQCVKDGRILYAVHLLGKANIGMYGGKEVLQHAIPAVMESKQARKEVLLDVKETHLTCTDKTNKQELFQHHFPEISCVGRFGSQPDLTIFAFCVLDPPQAGRPAGFCCVVLQAATSSECEEIVNRIAAGFKHTEWFV